jgi:hypothetical protein
MHAKTGAGQRGMTYHLRALWCPNHASIDPFWTFSCPLMKRWTSPSVHSGCGGMVRSMSVTLAAWMSGWRREEPSLETTTTAPKPNVLFEGIFAGRDSIEDIHCRYMWSVSLLWYHMPMRTRTKSSSSGVGRFLDASMPGYIVLPKVVVRRVLLDMSAKTRGGGDAMAITKYDDGALGRR